MQPLSGPNWFLRGGVGTTCCTTGKEHKLKQIYEIPPEHKKINFNYDGGQTLEQAMESPSLQIPKTQPDIALGNPTQVTQPEQRGTDKMISRPFPASSIL